MAGYIDLNSLEHFAKRIKEYVDIKTEVSHNYKTNCPNCGAPITSSKCEYCGTNFDPTVIFKR